MKTYQQFTENILQKGMDSFQNNMKGIRSFKSAIDQKFTPQMQRNAQNTAKQAPAFTKKHNSTPMKDLTPGKTKSPTSGNRFNPGLPPGTI